MSVHETKKKFAMANLTEALSMIRCGFELETQAYNGATWSDASESEIDEDAYSKACNEWVNDNIPSTLSDRHADIVREVLEDIVGEYIDISEFYQDASAAFFDVPSGIIAKSDSSVEGPELITDGPQTVSEFSRILRLLCEERLDVDEGCSFHIHLSIPGITHNYSKRFQALLFQGLMMQQLPNCVLDRMQKSMGYFKPIISGDKHLLVSKHRRLPTWEFRLFGNVDNWKDGMKCLLIAVRAMQYAYRVSLGREDVLFPITESTMDNMELFVTSTADHGLAMGLEEIKACHKLVIRMNRAIETPVENIVAEESQEAVA